MKIYFRFIILLALYGTYNLSIAQEIVPDINKKIIKFVDTVIGETVGRGECWDLADQALTDAGAQFDKSSRKTIYIFGKQYKPNDEAVLPGDFIQFEDVTVSYKNGNMTFTENYKHHTAIVYKVYHDDSMQIAHQNTSFGGRKVALSDFNIKNVKKGKLYFYHPLED